MNRCVILLLLCTFAVAASQTLEIHQMSVGQGDAAVIVVRDTSKIANALRARAIAIPANRYAMIKTALDSTVNLKGTADKAILIDASNQGAPYSDKIRNYLNKIGVSKLDYLVLSHYHNDHYGAFKDLLSKYKYTPVTAALDRGDGNPKPSSLANQSWKNLLGPGKRQRASVRGTNLELGPRYGQPIKFTCVAADCFFLGDDPTIAANSHCYGSNDQNDRSLGFLLQFGGFRFYTGGDLNGDEVNKNDLEAPMADSLKSHDHADFVRFDGTPITKGHVCSFKANHHGSFHSTNAWFLSVMNPLVALISCGYNTGHDHPRKEVIDDLDSGITPNWDLAYWAAWYKLGANTTRPNTVRNYYLTTLMSARGDTRDNIGTGGSKGIIGGDLVIVVDDANIATESKFAVYWNGQSPGNVVTAPTLVRAPNAAGINYYQCHRVNNAGQLHYITN